MKKVFHIIIIVIYRDFQKGPHNEVIWNYILQSCIDFIFRIEKLYKFKNTNFSIIMKYWFIIFIFNYDINFFLWTKQFNGKMYRCLFFVIVVINVNFMDRKKKIYAISLMINNVFLLKPLWLTCLLLSDTIYLKYDLQLQKLKYALCLVQFL